MNKTARQFRVEGHGQSVLSMVGGVANHVNPYVQDPLLTREGAWSTAKALMARGTYHTVKVYRGGTVVWRAFRQVDGTYVDAETCKRVG